MRSERFAPPALFFRPALLLSCVVAAAGCVDFDDSIFKKLDPSKLEKDAGGSGGLNEAGLSTDAGGNGGKDDGGSNGKDSGDEDAGDTTPRLVDRCDDPSAYRLTTALLSELNEISFTASTVGFGDDINQNACFTDPLPGSEGAMSVDMAAGERWHFHITPKNQVGMGQGKQNPVIYMRNDCSDNRGCNEGSFLDLCGDAQEEHFTFEAPTKGTWHFILDDKNNVQGDYLIRAVKNVCGNGVKEHNEACDTPGVGNCSPDCRLVLNIEGAAPDEPNDDFSASVILGRVEEQGSQTVKGSIGGVCDVDFYAFAVPDKGKVEARILTGSGAKCAALEANVSPTQIELLAPDAKTVLGVGMIGLDETMTDVACPFILQTDTFARNLDAGLYYLRVTGDETKKTFPYQLSIKVAHD